MRILKSFAIAFSIYSKIPMPGFAWEEEDMRCHLIFFPWVGMVIGGLEYLLLGVLCGPDLPLLFRVALAGVIPLIVTGGFHVDGFMDVQDALCSYKSKEEKLAILKDPHVGAFSVISLLVYVLLFGGALSLVLTYGGTGSIALFAFGFPVCRALGALVMLKLKKARQEGMLHRETRDTGTVTVAVLVAELLILLGLMLWIDPWGTLIFIGAVLFFTTYYRWKMYREFGGVTGDTTGYHITCSELVGLMAIAAWSMICR